MKAMYFSNTATSFNYNYNNITYTTSSIASRVIVPVCLDVTSNTAIEKGSILQAGASFFCSAQPSSSVVPCNSYLFYYDSIGCGVPGTGTARWYDCSGNLQTRIIGAGVPPYSSSFVECATSFGSQPCVLTQASGSNCTISLYVDGVLENTVSSLGTISTIQHNTSRTYFGCLNNQNSKKIFGFSLS